ncbi:GntR family transcriptional regulator [Hazenella coriacea]|uniref:GntR family transcriptional regulator n=1 Tax=Hazenella coriacea TaxID=1179467 RepID=A0A4R3L3I6_9BACL|nr:GntR family transcriptional regulator [Hazenella coriacea]TCS94203.1 GntR family transcriptional regulator [Hazenella coriacea]
MERPEPIYRQIHDQLQNLILSGQLTSGTPLPSIRSLAQNLSCSVITTRRVYQDLENEGLIYTKQGKGSFVADVQVDQAEQLKEERITVELMSVIEQSFQLHISKEQLENIFHRLLHEVYQQPLEKGEK